jgi:phage shock protein C
MSKKLYRSNRDVMLAGVLGGLAEYFNVDSTWVRLAFVGILLFTAGTPIFLYIAAAIIIPKSDVYN